MSYDAELILTEGDLKVGDFEIPLDLEIELTEQDVEHLKQTKEIDYYIDVATKIKLQEGKK